MSTASLSYNKLTPGGLKLFTLPPDVPLEPDFTPEDFCDCSSCQRFRREEAAEKNRVETENGQVRGYFPKNFREKTYHAATLQPMRSQKVRGTYASSDLLVRFLPSWLHSAPIIAVLPQCAEMVRQGRIIYPLFARPCPVRPRHGFVDSRVVNNDSELLALLSETLNADPEGELMLMPVLSGKASAIATDSGVVWGKGNDGVTAGKGAQFQLPTAPNGEMSFTAKLAECNKQLKQDLKGSVYAEIVENDGSPTIVQLRDGPAIAAIGGDYVPTRDYSVTHVLEVKSWQVEDLLAWEKQVLALPRGTAVCLQGGSLTSHAAVHVIARGLAAITTGKAVAVGDILQPADNQPPPLTERDYKSMAKMLGKPLPGPRDSRAGFAISVLHAMPAWGNDKHLLRMRAAGAMTMARLTVSACCGEARHYNSQGPGYWTSGAKPKMPWQKIIGKELPPGGGTDRGFVLETVYNYSLKRLRELASYCCCDFRGQWGSSEVRKDEDGNRLRQECGYGGPKWRKSSELARDFCTTLLDFKARPCADTWQRVVLKYNLAVNAAHNNGKLLNKWASSNAIDSAARWPQIGLLSPQAMFCCTGVPGKLSSNDEYYTAKIEKTKAILKAKVKVKRPKLDPAAALKRKLKKMK